MRQMAHLRNFNDTIGAYNETNFTDTLFYQKMTFVWTYIVHYSVPWCFCTQFVYMKHTT